MVTFFFDIAYVIKNQYLAYEIYINYMTKLIIMSGSEIFGLGLHFPLLLPYAAWDITGENLSQNSNLNEKKFFS